MKTLLFILAGIGLLAILFVIGFLICFFSQKKENHHFMNNLQNPHEPHID